MSLQPRLFADYAATPTARERSAIRAHWDSLAPTLFEQEAAGRIGPGCPVCGSTEHRGDACPHGTAPDLFDADGFRVGHDGTDRYADGFTPHE